PFTRRPPCAARGSDFRLVSSDLWIAPKRFRDECVERSRAARVAAQRGQHRCKTNKNNSFQLRISGSNKEFSTHETVRGHCEEPQRFRGPANESDQQQRAAIDW